MSDGGQLGGHPDKDLEKGIEISSGSLGQGLAIGAGISLINKKDKDLSTERGFALRTLLHLFERDLAVKLLRAG